ncbi:hypothetical protein HOC01_01115 [archaeon]|jgi:serine/threonine protein phosphatase PrpC|nr:hypothetical protein [archaeon]MBT6698557.1 hypothetical protein [archaeon]
MSIDREAIVYSSLFGMGVVDRYEATHRFDLGSRVVDVGGISDIGRRDMNQDVFVFGEYVREGEIKGVIVANFDGVGGGQRGEVASGIAAMAVAEYLDGRANGINYFQEAFGSTPSSDFVKSMVGEYEHSSEPDLVELAHIIQKVLINTRDRLGFSETSKFGTTVALQLFEAERSTIYHQGDTCHLVALNNKGPFNKSIFWSGEDTVAATYAEISGDKLPLNLIGRDRLRSGDFSTLRRNLSKCLPMMFDEDRKVVSVSNYDLFASLTDGHDRIEISDMEEILALGLKDDVSVLDVARALVDEGIYTYGRDNTTATFVKVIKK